MVGTYLANDPPQVGDLISYFSEHTKEGDPFHAWGTWRVDSVVWRVSHAGSQNVLNMIRETNGQIMGAFCCELDVLVWPAEGPFWSDMPKWAKTLKPADETDSEEA